jgi:hypothetical protein
MGNLDLFKAAFKRTKDVSASIIECRRFVVNTFNIIEKDHGHNANDILALLQSSSRRSFDFRKNKKPVSQDPALKELLNGLNIIEAVEHPIDEAYEIIKAAVNERDAMNKRLSGSINRLDPVNFKEIENIKTIAETGSALLPSLELIRKIFAFNCPQTRKKLSLDPINAEVSKIYGSGIFPEQPIHSLSEWEALLNSIYGRIEISGIANMNQANDLIDQEERELEFYEDVISVAQNEKDDGIDNSSDAREINSDELDITDSNRSKAVIIEEVHADPEDITDSITPADDIKLVNNRGNKSLFGRIFGFRF